MKDRPKVGDIVTAYVAGVHRIVEIDERIGKSSTGLAILEQICTGNMKKRRGKSQCDILFCRKVTHEMLDAWIDEHQKQIDAINTFREEHLE
ncbi:MAG: hypothetical protein ACYTE8_13005 [Planctomycetota bacterium]|jgi:hypothetical protein